jgi:lipoyl synthase
MDKKNFLKNYPSWLNIKKFNRKTYTETLGFLKEKNLSTVCLSANCPNRYECFSQKTATFLILGEICTRHCLYCNIQKGRGRKLDKNEPKKIAEAAEKLGLDYVVITCVSRDDLPDGGASHFSDTIKEIRKKLPTAKIEVLISDLQGDLNSLKKIISAKPDTINHNLETVERLFKRLRPQGNYRRSLKLLKRIKKYDKNIIVKSGLMAGLGESKAEIIASMKDLLETGCNCLSIGQYLKPNRSCVPIAKYYSPKEFEELQKTGKRLGFKKIFCGPLVRSSYRASHY